MHIPGSVRGGAIVRITDSQRQPWEETGAPGLNRKALRADAESGAQTILLRSASRPKSAITDRRPQYHPVDEEFLCLGGRFTLEGSHWLTPWTYVYYPPGLVHGFRVDVPGGYEIYLRNCGEVTTDRVDEPVHDRPYLVDAPEKPGQCIIANCADQVREAQETGELTVITLRDTDGGADGARLICLAAGQRIGVSLSADSEQVELFVVEGNAQLGDGTELPCHGHAVASGLASLEVSVSEPAVLMVNYRGEGIASALARQASVNRDCENSCDWF